MVKYRLKITDIVEEAFGTRTYYMEMPKDFIWEEGSHAHIGLEGYDKGEKPVSEWVRHMSIMTLPDENKIGFTTRKRENCSEFKQKLFDSVVGDEIVVFKPGSRMKLRRENRPVVLISMGVGIATMRPLLRAYDKDRTDISIMININVDASGEFLYKNDLDQISCDSCRNYWFDRREKLHDMIESKATPKNSVYYLVGSDSFIIALIHRLKEKGVSIEDIMIDKKPEFISRFLMISPRAFNLLL